MKTPLRVLIVEDNEDDAMLIARTLEQEGYDLTWERVDTPEAMSEALDSQEWDSVISDYVMPQFSGLDALNLFQDRGLDMPFIIVSGTIGEDIAVEAMRAGAHDYVMKGNLVRLGVAVRRELQEASYSATKSRDLSRRLLRIEERATRTSGHVIATIEQTMKEPT